MTLTETRPETAEAGDSTIDPRGVIVGWVTTGDHKRIGRMYIGASLAFIAGALVISCLLGFERASTSSTFLRADSIGQLFSLSSIGAVFLGVVPLLIGIAVYIVPLQVGARTIAFPRAAAASFWVWLIGSGMLIVAYAANGGPGGGKESAVDLFTLAYGLVLLGLLTAAVCVASTVLVLRAPGMRLEMVPAFTWASLVQAVMLLLTLPVLLANLIYLYVDHRYARSAFGGNFGMAAYIAWATRQPQTYLYAVPVLGFVAEVVPVFARARLAMHSVVLFAIGLAGLLGFGAFTQAQFAAGYSHQALNILMSLAAPIPPLLVLGVCALTLRAHRPKLASPLVFGGAPVFLHLAATAMGAFTFFPKLHLVDTVWEEAHFDYVVFGGLLAGLGALAYWAPKMSGRLVADKRLLGLGVLGFLALAALALPQVINGIIHQPLATVDFTTGNELLNLVSGIGAALLALVVLGVAAVILNGARRGGESGADPWGGHTLEWATTSPPPPANFSQPIGVVESERPLLDQQEGS
jgi:heme/copper-type cytochrome/quinol oxidase subunit 1